MKKIAEEWFKKNSRFNTIYYSEELEVFIQESAKSYFEDKGLWVFEKTKNRNEVMISVKKVESGSVNKPKEEPKENKVVKEEKKEVKKAPAKKPVNKKTTKSGSKTTKK